MDEAIYVDELPTLLDRFNPLIVDFKTDDKPSYIIVSNEDTKFGEYKYYNIKTNLGDTVLLAVVCVKPQEMVLEK